MGYKFLELGCRYYIFHYSPWFVRKLFYRDFARLSHTIIHEHLNSSKLSTHWIPKYLIEDHWTKRTGTALHFLSPYYGFGPLLDKIVTGDEYWVHFYTPEMKTQSMQRLLECSNPPKKFNTAPTVRKVFITVFWDKEGVLFVEFLPKSMWNDKIQVIKEWYMDTLMSLQRTVQNKYCGKLSCKILLLHNNARQVLHRAKVTQTLLNILKWEVLPHPSHSLDLVPSDLYLFSGTHVEFTGKRFHNNDKKQRAVHSYLQNLVT